MTRFHQQLERCNHKLKKWPRQQQTHRKIDIKSDWSDLDDGKDDQARSNPIVIDIILDQETTIDPQPSTSNFSASIPLRRPNTYPKVLSLGRVQVISF